MIYVLTVIWASDWRWPQPITLIGTVLYKHWPLACIKVIASKSSTWTTYIVRYLKGNIYSNLESTELWLHIWMYNIKNVSCSFVICWMFSTMTGVLYTLCQLFLTTPLWDRHYFQFYAWENWSLFSKKLAKSHTTGKISIYLNQNLLGPTGSVFRVAVSSFVSAGVQLNFHWLPGTQAEKCIRSGAAGAQTDTHGIDTMYT